MNTSQRALTWIPTYARKIKNIADEGFLKIVLSILTLPEKWRIYAERMPICYECFSF